MNRSLEPDPRFRSWLHERAPRIAPPGTLERAMAAALAAPQEGTWAGRTSLARFVPPIAASAGLVLLVVVGLLLTDGPRRMTGPAPEPSARASVSSAPSARPLPTPEATAPASSTPTTAPTAAPTSGASPTAYRTWVRHAMPDPAPGIFGGGTPFGVIRVADGYVALGSLVSRQGIPGILTVTWTSPDGRTWQLHENEEEFAEARVTGVASDGERHVVTGDGLLIPCCGVGPAAWISTDGLRWGRMGGPPPTIVWSGIDEFVGVTLQDSRSRFMASADASTWTETSRSVEGEVVGIAADAGRGLIAIGHQRRRGDGDSGASTDLVIWRSPDGSAWGEADVLVRDAVPTAVAAGPAGAIIAGQQYRTTREGAVTEALRIWRLTSTGPVVSQVPARPDGARQTIDRIALIGDTLIATGQEVNEGVESLFVLVSPDGGATWSRLPAQDAFAGVTVAVTGMIATPDGLIAVGRQWDPEAGHMVPVAWTAAR